MADDEGLFLKIIDRLAKGGVLTDIVLIGSWVLPILRPSQRMEEEDPQLR